MSPTHPSLLLKSHLCPPLRPYTILFDLLPLIIIPTVPPTWFKSTFSCSLAVVDVATTMSPA